MYLKQYRGHGVVVVRVIGFRVIVVRVVVIRVRGINDIHLSLSALRFLSICVLIGVDLDCTTLNAYAIAYCHQALAPPGSVAFGMG